MSKRVVLVVGAGDYIGSAICRRFAKEGFAVCMGRRNRDKLSPLEEELRTTGGEVHAYKLDARSEEDIETVFAAIESNVGPLEIVIFNVGGNVFFPILEMTSRVFRKVWEMACFAGFLTGREAAKYMLPRGGGSIFFTGATASMRGGHGYSAFASGKFGLRALAQSLARELGPKGIHVAHLVIDAGVDTAWVRERLKERGIEDIEDNQLMNPDSVADAYWYLHNQKRDAWTFELDVRPYAETW